MSGTKQEANTFTFSLSLPPPPNPSLYSHYCGVWDYFILFVEWPPSFSFNSSIFFSLGRKKEVAVSQRGLQPKLLKAGTKLYIWILVLFCFASPAKLYTLHLFFFSFRSLSSEILCLSFLIGTDFKRTSSNYWKHTTSFIENFNCCRWSFIIKNSIITGDSSAAIFLVRYGIFQKA